MKLEGLYETSQVKNKRKVILDENTENEKKISNRKCYSMLKLTEIF